MKKVVLAYSGGLDTSVAVAWLREQYEAEVVTLTVDLGGGSLREGVANRAMSAGASRASGSCASSSGPASRPMPGTRACTPSPLRLPGR
jgi:tRNA U34 2-thiouridine synthase MnmA/TrmU